MTEPRPGDGSSAELSPEALRRFLKARLPDYMVPATYVVLDALPLTANGKVDRRALPAPDGARAVSSVRGGGPRGAVEERLAAIWAGVLGVAAVGRDENFFDLGGTSIQTLRAAHEASAAGLRVTAEMIFQHQTVAELAVAAGGPGAGAAVAAPAEAPGAELPLVAPPRPEVGRASAPAREDEVAAPAGNTVIESLGIYLPPRAVSTDDVLRGCRKRVLFPLQRMTGIRTRRMAAETEFSIDLARRALAECLATSRHHPRDIDLLICCNISHYDGPHHLTLEPSTAVTLRAEFGFEHALAFDIGSACTGAFTAIHLADTLLRAGAVRTAAVVSGECISHLTSSAQEELDGFLDSRLACLTLGDAGMALTLERSARTDVGFHALELYTIGRYSDLCIARMSAEPHGGAIMYTDAIRQTAVGVKNAVMHATHVLERGRWAPETFDHLVMHQTSETALREAMRAINKAYGRTVCHEGNTIINLAERGNTATTSHFVAIGDGIRANRIRSNDRVVFGISGSGQTIGTALYAFDDLPDRFREARTPPRLDAPAARPAGVRPTRPRTPIGRIVSVGLCAEAGEPGRSAVEAARLAGEDCLERASQDRSGIGIVTYSGVYRDAYLCEPAIAAILAGELKINHDVRSMDEPRTLAFDVVNGAVGTLDACYLATRMLATGRCGSALVLAAEVETNALVRPELPRGIREVGSALLLETGRGDGRVGFGNFVFRYDVAHADALVAHTHRENGQTYLRVRRAADEERLYLPCVADAVRELFDAEELEPARVSAVFAPRLSAEWIAALSDVVGIPASRFVDADGAGDLFTSSFPFALRRAWDDRLVGTGDVGLVISVGSGLQAGCAVYYF